MPNEPGSLSNPRFFLSIRICKLWKLPTTICTQQFPLNILLVSMWTISSLFSGPTSVWFSIVARVGRPFLCIHLLSQYQTIIPTWNGWKRSGLFWGGLNSVKGNKGAHNVITKWESEEDLVAKHWCDSRKCNKRQTKKIYISSFQWL